MDSKQFAWLYLIEHGIAGCKHSYYGGYEIVDKRANLIPEASEWDNTAIKKFYLHELKHIGVNWDKLDSPKSDKIRKFNSTFADNSIKEILSGTIVLNNGSTQTWVADPLEVSNVFDMMATVSDCEARFKLLFMEG